MIVLKSTLRDTKQEHAEAIKRKDAIIAALQAKVKLLELEGKLKDSELSVHRDRVKKS